MKKILFILFILSFLSFANPNSAGPVDIIVTANVDNTNSTQLYIVGADSEASLTQIPIIHDGVNSSNANNHSAIGAFRVMRGSGKPTSINFPSGYTLNFSLSESKIILQKDQNSSELGSTLEAPKPFSPSSQGYITKILHIKSTLAYDSTQKKPLTNGEYKSVKPSPTLTVTLNKTKTAPQP